MQGQAGMPQDRDEPVAAQPVHIARIMPHRPLEQRRRQLAPNVHSRTRMPIADLLHGIRRQHPSRIDRPGIGVGQSNVGWCGAGSAPEICSAVVSPPSSSHHTTHASVHYPRQLRMFRAAARPVGKISA